MTKTELEERLIHFAGITINIVNTLSSNKAANHLSRQLVRSGTSHALNYGEARSAESLNDFIHKLQIILKELRETHVCLRIIAHANLHTNEIHLQKALQECDELISIFVKSVQTSVKKRGKS